MTVKASQPFEPSRVATSGHMIDLHNIFEPLPAAFSTQCLLKLYGQILADCDNRATKCDVIIPIKTPATLQLALSRLFCIAL